MQILNKVFLSISKLFTNISSGKSIITMTMILGILIFIIKVIINRREAKRNAKKFNNIGNDNLRKIRKPDRRSNKLNWK